MYVCMYVCIYIYIYIYYIDPPVSTLPRVAMLTCLRVRVLCV